MLLEIVERTIEPDIAVVELIGKLALGRESQRLEALIEDLLKRGTRRAVIDMSGVEYIDSAGIGLIALASGKFKESGGTLAVVSSEGRVLQLFRQTQIDTVVKVRPTVAEAANAV
jgi:anti-sigma B factor antagonist